MTTARFLKKKNWALLQAITNAGYSQRDLANMMGCHESIISRLVNMRANPTEDEKQRIANILDTRPETIFE